MLDTLAMLVNDLLKLSNTINNCLINVNIILYFVFSLNIYEFLKYHQYQIFYNQLKNHTHIYIVQFLSSTAKIFKIFCKHKGYAFNSVSFVLN